MDHDLTPEETVLADKVRGGDPQAVADFIRLRREPLLAYITRQLGAGLRRKLEPEDILQEISGEAVRSVGNVEFGDRDPFSWLCQLAQRRIIDAHRHFFGAQKRDAGREVGLGTPGGDTENPGLINLLVASMTTPSQAFSRNAKEARLQEAMAELPADHREILKLRYVDGWPTKQIAEKVGKSDAAIRVTLTRTLKKLQTMLGIE